MPVFCHVQGCSLVSEKIAPSDKLLILLVNLSLMTDWDAKEITQFAAKFTAPSQKHRNAAFYVA
jgi:hypothetical protein